MQTRTLAALLAAALAPTTPAAAHHSGAMFEQVKTLTLRGTVKEFQWTNPHCWIQLNVPSGDGAAVEWSVEMGAPIQLYQGGWKPGTLKTGDSIEVVIHPMRDGTKGGLFVSMTPLTGAAAGAQ